MEEGEREWEREWERKLVETREDSSHRLGVGPVGCSRLAFRAVTPTSRGWNGGSGDGSGDGSVNARL